jgi:glycosyltransferase involved in cell wall biosynthesis
MSEINYPFISAKCITYGRVDTLEESIYSFINQDYSGKKEMIIVNDYPLQKLVFDHPEVKIYNLDTTFATIGEKENFAMSKCSADIICQWDDDDVALPNHLNNVAKYFTEGSDLLHWSKGVFYNDSEITAITSLGNSGIIFSRKIWEKLGGYPIENAGYDMTFVMSIREISPQNVVFATPSDKDVSWFYMWGGRSYHMSGQGTDTEDRPNAIERHSAHIEYHRKLGTIPTGFIQLNPYWKQDYKKLLHDFITKD